MPLKSPYDHNERYTQESVQIADEFHHAIRPVFDKWVAAGYSIRQLSHLFFSEVWEQELIHILEAKPVLPPTTKKPLPRPKRAKEVQGDNPPKGIK
jgi:hypothetical protein